MGDLLDCRLVVFVEIVELGNGELFVLVPDLFQVLGVGHLVLVFFDKELVQHVVKVPDHCLRCEDWIRLLLEREFYHEEREVSVSFQKGTSL